MVRIPPPTVQPTTPRWQAAQAAALKKAIHRCYGHKRLSMTQRIRSDIDE